MVSTIFSQMKAPGTRVVESTEGYRVLEIASHRTCYMIGSSQNIDGDFLYNTPKQVLSLADFKNIFGSSPSEASVKLFFRNDPQGILYFVPVQIGTRWKITVTGNTIEPYDFSINATAISHTPQAGATQASIAAGILATINTSAVADSVTAVAGDLTNEVIIYADNPAFGFTITESEANLTIADITPTTPAATDYVWAIENPFDYEDGWNQGFLIAPEAFQLLTKQSDRLAVATAMENLASNDRFDWVAIPDPGAGLTLAQAKAEGLLVTSPEGHSSFYYPYLKDLEDGIVPPSAGVAGIASLRYRTQGFHQPPAGAKFSMRGVKDIVTKVSSQEQEEVNPLGINIIRNIRNRGVVVWGMRTRSSSEFYTFTHTRVIMNVLNGTLRSGFDNDLFTVVDGFGVYLNAISQTADSVCKRLWRGKALFGASEAQAFFVKCDFQNNTSEELERGNVLLEVYVVPSPAAEKILVRTIRVSIGYLPLATTASVTQAETTTT
jgi:phage tail sheath protein FI